MIIKITKKIKIIIFFVFKKYFFKKIFSFYYPMVFTRLTKVIDLHIEGLMIANFFISVFSNKISELSSMVFSSLELAMDEKGLLNLDGL